MPVFPRCYCVSHYSPVMFRPGERPPWIQWWRCDMNNVAHALCVPRRDSSRRLPRKSYKLQASVEISLDAARTSARATMRLACDAIAVQVSDDEFVFTLINVGPDTSSRGDFACRNQRRQGLDEQTLNGAL